MRPDDISAQLRTRLDRLSAGIVALLDSSAEELEAAARTLKNRRLFICGNGGSAAHALHLEAELVGRFRGDREPLPAVYLGLGESSRTAIANDFGPDAVFARPLRALARADDALLAISTSGTSPNVRAALDAAREIGVRTVLLSGPDAPRTAAEVVVRVAGETPDEVQDAHQLIIHALMCVLEPVR